MDQLENKLQKRISLNRAKVALKSRAFLAGAGTQSAGLSLNRAKVALK